MLDVSEIPLPEYAYVPGENARHVEGFLDAVTAMAPSRTSDNTSHSNIAWKYGLRLLEEGFYWEAHEVLETVWMNATPNDRERALVQGIIHIANAALKVKMQRIQAAKRLSSLAKECLTLAWRGHASKTLMGLDKELILNAAKASGQPAPHFDFDLKYTQ